MNMERIKIKYINVNLFRITSNFLTIFFLLAISISLASATETDINSHAVQCALQMTETEENHDTNLHFDYCQHYTDGQGLTGGFFGMCSGTGDMLPFVQYYKTLNSSNILIQYIPALQTIWNSVQRGGSEDSITGIQGMAGNNDPLYNNGDWGKACAQDPVNFRAAQFWEWNQEVWSNCVNEYTTCGCTYNVTLAIMEDAATLCGPDEMQQIVSAAISVSSSSFKTTGNCPSNLFTFFKARLQVGLNA